ncbi:MAG: four helix bundle protein, partial [Chloroflexota bacterium]
NFEEIRAWQQARILTKEIYSLSDGENFNKDFGLRDQIRRASVSIMANIAEGFDCDSQKEFARFLEIARRSAVEVQSLLYVALDVGYIEQKTFNKYYENARSTKALIGGFRHSLLKKVHS